MDDLHQRIARVLNENTAQMIHDLEERGAARERARIRREMERLIDAITFEGEVVGPSGTQRGPLVWKSNLLFSLNQVCPEK